jgi:hypothetical protein
MTRSSAVVEEVGEDDPAVVQALGLSAREVDPQLLDAANAVNASFSMTRSSALVIAWVTVP